MNMSNFLAGFAHPLGGADHILHFLAALLQRLRRQDTDTHVEGAP